MEKRGFTLIELLVSISIIAILSVIGFTVYASAQRSARDAKRKSDLRSIKVALELYKQTSGAYPVTDWRNSTQAQPWIPGLDFNYFPNGIPKDPINTGSWPWSDSNGYIYAYWSLACGSFQAGQFFVLNVQLENKNDKDNNATQDYKWCNGSGLYSTYGWSGSDYIITSL